MAFGEMPSGDRITNRLVPQIATHLSTATTVTSTKTSNTYVCTYYTQKPHCSIAPALHIKHGYGHTHPHLSISLVTHTTHTYVLGSGTHVRNSIRVSFNIDEARCFVRRTLFPAVSAPSCLQQGWLGNSLG